MSLSEIAVRLGVGKIGGGIDLTTVYEELLGERRLEVRKVLEIGIGHEGCMGAGYHPGASLRMWEEYFPNAEIFALDNRREILINERMITSFWADQSSGPSLRGVIPLLGDSFDLIIDDGSHVPGDQVLSALTFVPLLAPRGIYVIEDLWLDDSEKVVAALPYRSEVRDLLDTENNVGERSLIIRMEDQ